MKIAVLGAGAMGSIYGGHLSLHNDVYMIDKKQELVDKINNDGLKLFENDEDVIYRPTALSESSKLGEVDLVILFVKSLYSRTALMENRHIIGGNTYVMTLQNGAGHEDIISEFVPLDRTIIGTTEDNGAILDTGYVRRGGKGKTNIGMLVEDKNNMQHSATYLGQTFYKCFIKCLNRCFTSTNGLHSNRRIRLEYGSNSY